MTIHVAPDTVARQRFGSLLGTVTAVSAFPVTRDGIASLVGNAEVVTALTGQDPSSKSLPSSSATPRPSVATMVIVQEARRCR